MFAFFGRLFGFNCGDDTEELEDETKEEILVDPQQHIKSRMAGRIHEKIIQDVLSIPIYDTDLVGKSHDYCYYFLQVKAPNMGIMHVEMVTRCLMGRKKIRSPHRDQLGYTNGKRFFKHREFNLCSKCYTMINYFFFHILTKKKKNKNRPLAQRRACRNNRGKGGGGKEGGID